MRNLKVLVFTTLTLITLNAQTKNLRFKSKLNVKNNLAIISAFVQNSNIFIRYADKSTKQLTFANSDSFPRILKNENAILFVRNTNGDIDNPKVKKIMKVYCNSLIEKTVTDKKSFRDGNSFTYYILSIGNPTLSNDEQYVYFTTECYATGDELVKVDLKTGKWLRLLPADNFQLIKKGQYKNLLLIVRTEVKAGSGRQAYFYLTNEKDEVLKEFNSEDNYNLFKKEELNN